MLCFAADLGEHSRADDLREARPQPNDFRQ